MPDKPVANSELSFRLLMESVRDYGIFMLDREGYIQTWNEGAKRINGYTADEVIGKHFSIFYPEEDIKNGKPPMELRVAIAEGRYEEEGWRLKKDGLRFWASVVITALFEADGTLRGFGKVTRDLSAKKEAEEQLRQSEERYRLLVSSVKDYAIFLINPEGLVTTWNTGAEILMGYSGAEIIGKHFSKFYSKEDLDRNHPTNELKIAKETGRYEEEGWRYRKDGTKFWANILLTRLEDHHGHHIGFTKITRDLTERKKAQESLIESEERMRLMIEAVKDYAIIRLDENGFITNWNEGARRLKGYEAEEIKGKHFSQFYEVEDVLSGKCDRKLIEAAAAGRYEDEGWRVRKDGSRFWANVVITALRDNTGQLRGFTKVTRDITEKKRAEDTLKAAHESLEKRVADRTKELEAAVESRDEFLSIASHELRTPLTALKLQQQIFERQMQKSNDPEIAIARAKDISEMTKRQVAQLTRLVDDMLDVSRIATGRLRLELKECSISEITRRVFNLFTAQFQHAGVAASLTVEDNLMVLCDEHRIEQVLSNLLSNALKYGKKAPIDVKVVRRGKFAELTVHDHGPGISKADQERIFKRYERAISANEVSGLGLGLFISDQILQSHGGSIEVESEPLKGSAFTVSLPLLP